jgi:hypothetical protein
VDNDPNIAGLKPLVGKRNRKNDSVMFLNHDCDYSNGWALLVLFSPEAKTIAGRSSAETRGQKAGKEQSQANILSFLTGTGQLLAVSRLSLCSSTTIDLSLEWLFRRLNGRFLAPSTVVTEQKAKSRAKCAKLGSD